MTITTTTMTNGKTLTGTTKNDWWEKEQQKQWWDWFNKWNREIEGDDYKQIITKITTITIGAHI